MKRFFLALLLPLAAVLTSWAQITSIPEAFYLVGNINSWSAPAYGGTQYKIISPAGDGIYTAEFDIPYDDLQFKVFSSEGDWGDASNIWGCYFSPGLYSDRTWQQNLTCDGPYYSAPNISIANWVAGNTLSVRITLLQNADDTYTPVLTLSCAGQPAKGSRPEVTLAGSFCDADEGRLTLEDDNSEIYTGSFNASGESLKFQINVKNDLSSETYSIDCPPFTLTNADASTATPYYFHLVNNGSYIEIADWHGGRLDVTVDLERLEIILSSPDAPAASNPESMYAVVTTDKGTTVEPIESAFDYIEGFSYGTDAAGASILFSTENSTTPASENIWGFSEGASIYCDAPGTINKTFQLIQGGEPLRFEYTTDPGFCNSSITVNWRMKLAGATAWFRERPNQRLYLIGSLQGWNILDGSLELEKEYDGLFYGEFDVPATDESLVFRFYSALGDWESNSIGSQEIDLPVGISLPYTGGLVVGGKGSWEIINRDAETLCVWVDFNNGTVVIRGKDNGGVADVTADPAAVRIEGDTAVTATPDVIEAYNASGILVRRAEGTTLPLAGLPAGMYIIASGNSALKVVR